MSRRTPLVGWLTAETISLTGTRVSMIAIPWFVLTTTGSATQTGVVAFAEMAPYVLAKALAGPLVDRIGARRVCVATDSASFAAVGAIPLLHAVDVLTFPLLVALVAVAGALRGPADGAKHALVPAVADASAVPMERVTGLAGAAERLASTVGAAAAGLVVVAVGPAPALVIDAASFAVAALLIALTAPGGTAGAEGPDDAAPYLTRFREGWRFLRHDPVLVAITGMVAVTNLLDQAYVVVLVPVWAERSGGGAAVIGLLFATFSAFAVLGSVIAATIAERLPRRLVYLVAFLIVGAPRFVVLAIDAPLAVVLAVAVVGGFATGFINPILGAVIFERIPARLVGRVTGLTTSLCWALIPLGGLAGGLAVGGVGLTPALLVFGAAYFAATTLPALLPQWREIDRRPAPAASEVAVAVRDPSAV
ncbi:MAG: MFS transporter [Nocardioidaceae bacterium]|nr:MFS transporter [Nocardioidaceae bacterium]